MQAELIKLCSQPLQTPYSPSILKPQLEWPTSSVPQFPKPYLKSCCAGLSRSVPLPYTHMSDFSLFLKTQCLSDYPRGRLLCPHPWSGDNREQEEVRVPNSHCTEHVYLTTIRTVDKYVYPWGKSEHNSRQELEQRPRWSAALGLSAPLLRSLLSHTTQEQLSGLAQSSHINHQSNKTKQKTEDQNPPIDRGQSVGGDCPLTEASSLQTSLVYVR